MFKHSTSLCFFRIKYGACTRKFMSTTRYNGYSRKYHVVLKNFKVDA